MTTLLSTDAQTVFDRASGLTSKEREELALALWESLPVTDETELLKTLHAERIEHEQGKVAGRTATEVFAEYAESWP